MGKLSNDELEQVCKTGDEARRLSGQQVMVQQWEVIEICIDRRTIWARLVGSWVLESGNVAAQALAVSPDKPLEWSVGFFLGNTELSLELWNITAGISGFDDL